MTSDFLPNVSQNQNSRTIFKVQSFANLFFQNSKKTKKNKKVIVSKILPKCYFRRQKITQKDRQSLCKTFEKK
jgi:hypothetical protein